MIADFVIFEATLKPEISATLENNGIAVNLTGATIKFRMRPAAGGTLKVDAAAAIVDATLGQVRYEWVAADLNTAGTFRGWWLVTFSDGKTAIFPGRKTYIVEVKAAP